MATSIPKFLHRFFWGDKLDELNLEKHGDYVAKTILEKGDRPAAAWLLKTNSGVCIYHESRFFY